MYFFQDMVYLCYTPYIFHLVERSFFVCRIDIISYSLTNVKSNRMLTSVARAANVLCLSSKTMTLHLRILKSHYLNTIKL